MKPSTVICLFLSSLFFVSCGTRDPKSPLEKAQIVRLYEQHSGQEIGDSDDFCSEDASSFPGVYALGWFAHDRGCMGNEVLFGEQIDKFSAMAPVILAAFGWAEEKQRTQLAMNLVKEVMLSWESPISSRNEDFDSNDTPDFSAPISTATERGIEVVIWVKEPGGMLPQSDYSRLKVVFDKDGELLESDNLDHFTVRYK